MCRLIVKSIIKILYEEEKKVDANNQHSKKNRVSNRFFKTH
jgi:hypothetical protein